VLVPVFREGTQAGRKKAPTSASLVTISKRQGNRKRDRREAMKDGPTFRLKINLGNPRKEGFESTPGKETIRGKGCL